MARENSRHLSLPFYITYINNTSIPNTAILANIATITSERLLNAPISATAVPTIAESTFPEQYIINGKVIADNTA